MAHEGRDWGARALILSAAIASASAALAAEIPTDRVIVRLKGGAPALTKSAPDRSAIALRLSAKSGEVLAPVRVMGDGAQVMRLPRRMTASEIRTLFHGIEDADVLEILPDRIFLPAAVPNESQFGSQWSLGAYPGIGVQAAWPITTGSVNAVVGVVDSGRTAHEDLNSRWVGGHDFVSIIARGGDGGGRDGDPSDAGDWVTTDDAASGPLAGCVPGDSRWHGTAMAGIIGAATGNGVGVAGINHLSPILPIRVAGKCGAYESDLADGLRWGAGIPVAGIPANTNVAAILNASLSAPGVCSGALQGAINEVGIAGVSLVVAAGNQGLAASGYSPGNCANVVTVAAVDRTGAKVGYTNYGTEVTLAAPGGVGSGADAVTVPSNPGTQAPALATDFYRNVNGTSVAAAHVSGVASLMLSSNPSLKPATVKMILQSTARAFPTTSSQCTTSLCGAGIVDAGAAVGAASRWGIATPFVDAGSYMSAAVDSTGRYYLWGAPYPNVPQQAPLPEAVRQVSLGFEHFVALRADGTVWAWGINGVGQLGNGTTGPGFQTTPTRVLNLSNIVAVSAGWDFTLALRSDGTVWAWGLGFNGNLGDGTYDDRSTPVQAQIGNVVAIAAGRHARSSLALKSDGTVWCFGACFTTSGTTVFPSTPTQVTGLPAIKAIAHDAGHYHALAVGGTLWSWGENGNGQIGNGATDPLIRVFPPVQVMTGVSEVAAGLRFTVALKTDGSVWAWGDNFHGQLGRGGTHGGEFPLPAQVVGLSGVSHVSAGEDHAAAAMADGRVFTWGSGGAGGLGIGSVADPQTTPVRVLGAGGTGYLDIGLADPASFASQFDVPTTSVRTSNTITVNGIANGSAISIAGGSYSLGCGATFVSTPGTINNGQAVCVRQTSSAACNATSVATLSISGYPSKPFSVRTACDTTPDAFVFAPQGGVIPGATATSAPMTIAGITNAAPISVSGGTYSVGCTDTFTSAPGTVAVGQSVCARVVASGAFDTVATATIMIGNVQGAFHATTRTAPGFHTTPRIAASSADHGALRSDGSLLVWGSSFGPTPAVFPYLSGIREISFGLHALALRGDGTVWAWGQNDRGQLGNGTILAGRQAVPTRIVGLTGVSAVASGSLHSVARKPDGSVWTWGDNSTGALGTGNFASSTTPVMVPGFTASFVAAGFKVTFAVKADGSVWCWGTCPGGGSTPSPVQLPNLSAITALAVEFDHVLALRSDGTVWAWGSNDYGQIGNGSASFVADVYPPVMVVGLTGVVRIGAGGSTSFAVKSDGTTWAWGSNLYGQLGIGTSDSDPSGGQRSLPTQVVGMTGPLAIQGGAYTTLALKPDGSVWVWGGGYEGFVHRGDANPGDLRQPSPLPVLGIGGAGFLDVGVSDPSNFAPRTNVAPGSVQTSNTITYSGIANGASVSISGGSFSVGCSGTFIGPSATMNNGQSVCVRQTASAGCGATTTITLSVAGAVARSFSVTTYCDATPEDFAFEPKASVPLSTVVTSGAVTVSGIVGPAPISVLGGTYSIGCSGTFTASPGTITSGQTVCLRHTSAASYDTMTAVTLTIGSLSAAFDVTTLVGPAFNIPPQLKADISGAIALRSDGRVYLWGWSRFATIGSTATLYPHLSGARSVAIGDGHFLAVRGDGSVWAWGANYYGQLGNGGLGGSTHPLAAPLRVIDVPGAVAVAAGFGFSLALTDDGTVWAWGGVDAALLRGDVRPRPVDGLTGVTSITVGSRCGLALRSDGTVWRIFDGCWHSQGRTGAVQLPGLAGITRIASGALTLALRGDGVLFSSTDDTTFAPVPGLSSVVEIAASGHALALTAEGSVWAWGENFAGQLGLAVPGGNIPVTVPTRMPTVRNADAAAAGPGLSFVILGDGSVLAAGMGYLGDGQYHEFSQSVPVQVLGPQGDGALSLKHLDIYPNPFSLLPRVGAEPGTQVTSNEVTITGLGTPSPIAVSGGTYAINGGAFTASAGTVANNDRVAVRAAASASLATTTSATLGIGGAAGQASTFYVRTRAAPNASRVVPQVAAGHSHTLILAPEGDSYGAGYNGNGQLGNGSTLGLSSFRAVAGLSDAVALSSGAYHSLALRRDGTLLAWGSNLAGQLGVNSTRSAEPYPVSVPGLATMTGISAGNYHSVALRLDGTVWAWGLNTNGQLGHAPSVASSAVPMQVPIAGIVAVAAGGRHTLALHADGTVYAWGGNDVGQLGDGTLTSRGTPAPVPGLVGAVAIAAGEAHSLALRGDGSVVAWGFNAFGQLGDGTSVDKRSPTLVSSLGTNVGLIAAGANHSLAVKVGGALYTWGNNSNDQLGVVGPATLETPMFLLAAGNVVSVAGGARHSAAMDSRRRVRVWGDNTFGQVGNRSGNYSPHSASLNVLRGDSVISTGTSSSGGGVGTGSNSGSSVLEVDSQQAGFDFGSIGQGTSRSVGGRYKNAAATENVTGLAVSVSGSAFQLAGSSCPGTLVPEQECTFTIAFNPPSAGNFGGELAVQSSVVGAPERRSLAGTAVGASTAAVTLVAPGVDFPPQTVWTSTTATLGVTNSGNANLVLGEVTSTLADFSATHDCNNVAPGTSCTLTVTFVPTATNSRVGQLAIPSNASGSPHPLTVSGTGAASSGPTPSFLLTIAKTGAGTGTVASTTPASPAIACGGACSGSYLAGTTVTLAATPAAGSVFAGWAGPCTGTGACTVTMNQARTVTAAFALPGTFPLTVVRDGTGSGTVASTSPASPPVDCGPTCIASFTSGTVVTLAATPAAGSTFTSWSGACSGSGSCQVTMSAARTVTATFTLANPPRLGNISTRMQVGTGNDVMIGGFVIGGSSSKTVAIVATGPSLVPFGITNPLANPMLTLVRSSDQAVLATNDNWGDAANAAQLITAGFAPSHTLEAAILVNLPPGAYTAIVQGSGGGTGVSVIGVYEVDALTTPLVNISSRGRVLTGNDVMIGGFIINGSGPQTVAIVATGPSLAPFGIENPLANPTLTIVRSSDQAVIATNDDWQQAANAAELQTAGFAPTNPLESGLLLTLPPGAYTAIVQGAGGGTGVAVIGVYKVN